MAISGGIKANIKTEGYWKCTENKQVLCCDRANI